MKRKGKGERYLSLRHWLLKSPAWRSLPAVSRALYLELSHFGGVRQGMAKGLAGLKPEAQGAAGLRRTRPRVAVGAMSTSHRAARRGGQRGADAVTGYPEPGQPPKQAITIHPEIRIAVDLDHRRVVFDRWGEIKGAGAELLMFLADTFRRSASAELAPERYPFARTRDLLHELQLDSEEALRRRVFRCRKQIEKLAMNVGDPPPSTDDVIENHQWHGYRLNPDVVRIVAMTELTNSGP